MDLGGWLRSLGLERYEAAFRENEIDETVLPSLTHETLKELGVTAVGHRLKLLDAIAALRPDGATKPDSVAEATALAAPSVTSEDRAERRQVTVMFSDLVGSTALSARMDPEDLREVIAAYQKCVAEIVRRFGGFVAKYMGDGVLVYFGLNTHPVRCTTLHSGQLSEPKNARYWAQKLLGVPIAQTAGLGLPPRLRAGPPDLRLQPSTFLAGVFGRQSTYG
jgi:class 3 adenylate cyclase